MDNKAQLTVEYLIMVALGIGLSAVVLLLAANLFAMKEGVKESINLLRREVF